LRRGHVVEHFVIAFDRLPARLGGIVARSRPGIGSGGGEDDGPAADPPGGGADQRRADRGKQEQKADRIGIKRLADGKRVRYFKSNGEMLDA